MTSVLKPQISTKEIPNYEGMYSINNLGEVFSLDRKIHCKDGSVKNLKGRKLIPGVNPQTGYLEVALWKDNVGTTVAIHRLVAKEFVPNPDNLPEVNHDDGNKLNPIATNLSWVTSSENSYHAVQTGLRTYTNRLTKEEFIECLYCVINGESYASLCVRVPYKVPFLSTKLRKIARELGIEPQLDGSLYEQRVIRARINGAKAKK